MSTAIPTATPPEQPSASTEPGLSRLSRGIREYSLFQGVQLVLERLQAAHPELDEEALYQHLELQANPSMGFPGSDIDRVQFFEEHGELRARLRINLVSLFGAGSPLPAFYGEQALGDSEDGNPTRAFLDLFNNRLQRLLLPTWQKYRYHARFQSGAADPFSEQLFALIGLPGARLPAPPPPHRRNPLPPPPPPPPPSPRPPLRPGRPGRPPDPPPLGAELETPAALPRPAQPARPLGSADRVGAALLLQARRAAYRTMPGTPGGDSRRATQSPRPGQQPAGRKPGARRVRA